MRVVVITPPERLVYVDEAMEHLEVEDDGERSKISGFVAAATAHIDGPDGWLGRAIGIQTLEARFDSHETRRSGLRLPYPPHIDIVSVSWLNAARQRVVGNAEDYELIGDTVYPIGAAPWSGLLARRESLSVQYRAGYSQVSTYQNNAGELITAVPDPIRAAILLMAGDMYRNRETVTAGTVSKVPMSTTVENLLGPFRKFS